MKFFAGDVLKVYSYDQGDEVWQWGIIQILDYIGPYASAPQGTYKTLPLRGSITFIAINSYEIDNARPIEDCRIHNSGTYVNYVGNISDKAIRVLYGIK